MNYFCLNDSNEDLAVAYDNRLKELFTRPLWERGTIDLRRVLWSDGERARTEDSAAFKLSGIYIWGIEDRPLYIGKTGSSFGKRFHRYIWHPRSQCKLASEFEPVLTARGIDGFPQEIREWYRTSFRGSTVRLNGAVRFA